MPKEGAIEDIGPEVRMSRQRDVYDGVGSRPSLQAVVPSGVSKELQG